MRCAVWHRHLEAYEVNDARDYETRIHGSMLHNEHGVSYQSIPCRVCKQQTLTTQLGRFPPEK